MSETKKINTPASFRLLDLSTLPAVPCPCGTSRRAFGDMDNAPCSVHLVEISQDSRTHYHKRLTEVYYFLSGEGHMELNGKLHPVKPGDAVMIRPGTRHRAVPGESPMKVVNFVVPGFDPDDEWFDEPARG